MQNIIDFCHKGEMGVFEEHWERFVFEKGNQMLENMFVQRMHYSKEVICEYALFSYLHSMFLRARHMFYLFWNPTTALSQMFNYK